MQDSEKKVFRMKPSPTPPTPQISAILAGSAGSSYETKLLANIRFTLLKHKCELLGFETNHIMQKWLISMFHKRMEGNSQNPPFCYLSFFKTSGTHPRPMDPELVQIEITALVHFLRRKANQVTVGTAPFSWGCSLNMFCQWKKPHCFQTFHSSTVFSRTSTSHFLICHLKLKKTVLNWKNTHGHAEIKTQDNKTPKTFHNTTWIVLLCSKYGTLVISLIDS